MLTLAAAYGQEVHLTWTVTADPAAAAPGGKALLKATGRVDPGWHVYSASTPAGIPTSFTVDAPAVVERTRLLQPAPRRSYDKNFEADTETFDGDVTLLLELTLRKDAPAGPVQLPLKARFQTCSDTQCVVSRWQGSVPLNVDTTAAATVPIPAGFSEAKPPANGAPRLPARDSPPSCCSLSASAWPASSRPASSQ